MGLAATVMIATGLLLWIIKRRDRHAEHHLGYRIVESLNVAVVAGLLVAVAAFLWANRLLPVGLSDRAVWEMASFFFAWGLCAMHGFIRRRTSKAWQEQLSVAATLFALLPLLNMVSTADHLFVTLPARNWRLAGIDLTCLAIGAMLYGTVRRIRKSERATDRLNLEPLVSIGQG